MPCPSEPASTLDFCPLYAAALILAIILIFEMFLSNYIPPLILQNSFSTEHSLDNLTPVYLTVAPRSLYVYSVSVCLCRVYCPVSPTRNYFVLTMPIFY